MQPVLIIGGGPVGQTSALLLARHGIPTVLLDSRPARDVAGSKAICQQRDVLDVWSWCGVPEVATEGLTWTRARTMHRDAELFCLDLPDPGRSPLPPFVNISQSRTEELLDAAIAQDPLIEVRWGHHVSDLVQEADGAQVRITCSTPTGEVQLSGAYAVACCGARGSRLRELLGVDFPGRTFEDAFLICDIRADLPGWEHERRFYFDPTWNPGRQVLIHPCPEGVYRIDWQVEPTFDLEQARADGSLEGRVRQIIGRRPYTLVWTSLYHFHSRLASRFRAGRVFLAGDLAHLLAPFGARGLNSGIADVDNLAWKLAWVLRGWADAALLDSYEDERRPAAQENLEVTTATMNFLVPQTDAARARRQDLLRRAADDQQARAQVDSGRLAEPYWYVDSPLTTGSSDRPWSGRPERGTVPDPVPGVILPDVPLPGGRRLRDVVRGRLTALCTSSDDVPAAGAALREACGPGVPVQAVALSDLGREAASLLTEVLACRPGESWLVRPDAHTAACVSSPQQLAAASRRVLAGRA